MGSSHAGMAVALAKSEVRLADLVAGDDGQRCAGHDRNNDQQASPS